MASIRRLAEMTQTLVREVTLADAIGVQAERTPE